MGRGYNYATCMEGALVRTFMNNSINGRIENWYYEGRRGDKIEKFNTQTELFLIQMQFSSTFTTPNSDFST